MCISINSENTQFRAKNGETRFPAIDITAEFHHGICKNAAFGDHEPLFSGPAQGVRGKSKRGRMTTFGLRIKAAECRSGSNC
jgi:hypothetical protein